MPVELEWLVGKCLAKAANERYQSAGELLVDLAARRKGIESAKSAVLKTAVGGTTSRLVPALGPASKRKYATTVALAACGLLILLAVAFVAGTRFTGEAPTSPTYKRLTFRRGTVTSARFGPDGNTIVYSAAWEGGRRQLYSTRLESSESRPLNIQDADILSISKTGEMALALRPPGNLGHSFGAGNQNFPPLFCRLPWPAGLRVKC